MADEYVTTTTEPRDGAATSHTTIVRDEAPRRSSGAGWVIAIVLVLAVIAGFVLMSQASTSEAVKDNAIADAAGEVGSAATAVGDAAQDAAKSITN